MVAARVLIVDPHPIIADSLCLSLEQHSSFLLESCTSYAEAMTCATHNSPQIVVLNVYPHTCDESLRTCRELAALVSTPLIVLLAPQELVERDTFMLDAVEAGADGVLIREQIDLTGLVSGLQRLEDGVSLLDPRRLRDALACRRSPSALPENLPTVEKLTPREREVAELISQGKSTGEIATELTISERTVQTHIGNILAKLEVRTRAEAAVQLYQWRLAGQHAAGQ